MKLLKPGLHWDDIQLLCHCVLIKGFQALGIFKSPSSPGSGSWNSAEAILASGISSAFFPHGVGHSLGMDVHDVPEASKPADNPTIQNGETKGHESFYPFLRLRLPLEKNMVVVGNIRLQHHNYGLLTARTIVDGGTWVLFLTSSHCARARLEAYQPGRTEEVRRSRRCED